MKRAADDVIDLTNEEDSPVKKRPHKQESGNRKKQSKNEGQQRNNQDRSRHQNQKKGQNNGGFGYSDPWAPYGYKLPGGACSNMRGQGMGGPSFNMGGLNRGFGQSNGIYNGYDQIFGGNSGNVMNGVGSRDSCGFDSSRRGSGNDFSDNDFFGTSFQDFPADDVFSHPSDIFRVKLLPDPEDFVQLAEVLTKFIDPQMAISGAGKWTALTQSIVKKFNMSQQPKQMIIQKIDLWKEMYRAIRTEFDCSICVFGSTFNGFGGSGSDLDMCLFPHHQNMDAKFTLSVVRRVIRKQCRNFINGDIELVPAKVPILKFFDREGRLEVDLSVNNPTSIRNTHLLYCYSQLDYRVRPIVLAVKLWAKAHNINEARLMTLSSYALTLMVVHFLQAGVRPPVLPCLNQMFPNVFNPNSDIFQLSYHPRDLPLFQSSNSQSIGELLAAFVEYYATEFNPCRDVGSIRVGRVLDAEDCARYAKENKLSPGQWNAKLLLEEPFDRTNAARSVINIDKWKDVTDVFNATQRRLVKLGGKAELQDIMSPEILSKNTK